MGVLNKSEVHLRVLQRLQQRHMEQLMYMQQYCDQQLQQLLGQHQQLSLTLTLPHAEVQTFVGDPVNYVYCNFIRSVENVIEAKTKSSSANLYYLVQYTSSDVQELIRSCLSLQPAEGADFLRQHMARATKSPPPMLLESQTDHRLSTKTAKHFRSFPSFSQAARTP